MRTRIVILLFLMISSMSFGQDLNVNLGEISVTPPKFAGIRIEKSSPETGSIETYIKDNIVYPDVDGDLEAEWYNEGTEVVQFVITPKGEVTDLNVINSVSKEIDNEVLRILKTTNGMWVPGKNNEDPVAMEKEVSIAFKIKGYGKDTDFKTLAQKYAAEGTTLLLRKENPKKALKSFNKGIKLLPYDKCLLMSRGLAKYELGDKEGAYKDWFRLKTLGGNLADEYLKNFEDINGYADLTRTLNK